MHLNSFPEAKFASFFVCNHFASWNEVLVVADVSAFWMINLLQNLTFQWAWWLCFSFKSQVLWLWVLIVILFIESGISRPSLRWGLIVVRVRVDRWYNLGYESLSLYNFWETAKLVSTTIESGFFNTLDLIIHASEQTCWIHCEGILHLIIYNFWISSISKKTWMVKRTWKVAHCTALFLWMREFSLQCQGDLWLHIHGMT